MAAIQEMWIRVRQLLKGEGIADGKSKAACLNASPRFQDPSAAGYVDPFRELPSWISKGEFKGKDPEVRIGNIHVRPAVSRLPAPVTYSIYVLR